MKTIQIVLAATAAAAVFALASCSSTSAPPNYSAPQTQGSYYAPSK